MNIIEATKTWFKKGFSSKGCSTREEYWLGFAGFIIISIIVSAIDSLLKSLSVPSELLAAYRILYLILLGFPLLTATIRRLHDVNRTGDYLLIGVIPIIGEILIIIELCKPSVIENNKYRNNETKKEAE